VALRAPHRGDGRWGGPRRRQAGYAKEQTKLWPRNAVLTLARRTSPLSTLAGEASALAKARHYGRDFRSQRHGAGLAALGRGHLAGGEGRADAQGAGGEVDVAPAKRQQLAAAQAGERGGEVDDGVLRVGRSAHEGADLLR
jgi:hypothetical protein